MVTQAGRQATTSKSMLMISKAIGMLANNEFGISIESLFELFTHHFRTSLAQKFKFFIAQNEF